ncbi:hypothetical protein GCM10010245_12590 [Streptomyces spectabilis]|nr:hypothetical protein GCM10010245_12590 [Streptomyces spectabilis]
MHRFRTACAVDNRGMSQQGERPTGQEADWWAQLYDEARDDTGPAAAGDSLDDRFASAAGTVGPEAGAPPGPASTADSRGGRSAPRDATTYAAGSARVGPADDGPPAPTRPPDEFRPKPPAGRAEPPPPPRRPWPPEPPARTPDAKASPSAGSAGPPSAGPWPEADEPPAPGARPSPSAGGAEPPSAGPPPPSGRPWSEKAQPPAPARPPGVEPPRSPAAPPAAPPAPPGPAPAVPPRTDPPTYRAPAPWTPATPAGPVTFPSAPERPAAPPVRSSTESSDATVPASRTPESSAEPDAQGPVVEALELPARAYVGDGPPTYEAEPTGLPAADPDDLGSLVADTVLDGARYGSSTLRAVSVRGDSARYRAEPRRDALLTARFGAGDDALVLVAMATGARATAGAHRAAADACAWIGRAVGRSHARLAQDIRAARRGDLKSGLHRLTDRSLGKLRARAADLGLQPDEYTASLRCLLLPADPRCRTRVFFGVGSGGLFRLRGGEWQDIEPRVATTSGAAVVGFGSPPTETPEGDRLTMDLGITSPPSPYEPAPAPPRDPFRFRASVARPGDALLLCTGGLAEPLRGEPELSRHLTRRWAEGGPPGLAAFLADTQVRVKGYADDRTAAAVWEA